MACGVELAPACVLAQPLPCKPAKSHRILPDARAEQLPGLKGLVRQRQAGAHAGVLAAQQAGGGVVTTFAAAPNPAAHVLAMEHVYRYLQRFYVDMSSTPNLTRQASTPA